jgi:hypothetical protein
MYTYTEDSGYKTQCSWQIGTCSKVRKNLPLINIKLSYKKEYWEPGKAFPRTRIQLYKEANKDNPDKAKEEIQTGFIEELKKAQN